MKIFFLICHLYSANECTHWTADSFHMAHGTRGDCEVYLRAYMRAEGWVGDIRACDVWVAS